MSHDGLEIVRRLVDVVARTFYEDKHVLALDYLNRYEIARIDVLAKYLHVKNKEAFQIYKYLAEHRLVKVVMRADAPTDNTMYLRRSGQSYYYIDYKQFVDVVKWRMYKLKEQVRMNMDKEQQNLGYDCVRCVRRFAILEAVSLRDPATGVFRCDYCGDELVDHTSLELAQESQKEFSRIMDKFNPIIDLLRKTESITLPAPTPLSKVPVPDIAAMDAEADGKGRMGGNKGLGIARDTGAASGDTVIEFAPDLSPKEAARIREAELEKKLRQNALPAWHIWSSVSGVQMVPDQKITPEAALKHRRYVERRNVRKNRWNRRERDRAKLALREVEEQMRAGVGRDSVKEAGEDEMEARREALYAKYYTSVAQRSGIAIPHDPREHYKKLLEQLAKYEELEKAEMEKRKQEMERIEKERKEAVAAAASAYGDRNGNNAYRYRKRFNPHTSYSKFGRNSHRRRMTQRLFEFVGAELNAAASEDDGSDEDNGDDALVVDEDQVAEDGSTAVDESSLGEDGKRTSSELPTGPASANGVESDEPDPYLEGIYALSQTKRRKLGLDDPAIDELANSSLDMVEELPHSLLNVDIYVGGHPKAIAHITPEDEGKMTTEEYVAYWDAWHQAQAV
ncbi:hypothetical protein IWW51_000542 [Coemansia sp. RSA 2702]|nr:hypothetical protein IWW52_000215 [Coemansia sp. RSA 2704]KAJ2329543.1 hypothetical protein IWW51_000542 [Coemansia sp. RSA 2702]